MAVTDKTSADAAYIAGLSYESDSTGATALSFLSAIRYYLQFDAKSYSVGGRMLMRRDLESQEKAVMSFMKASPVNGARPNMVTHGRTCGLGI
jgi:hypothetical protein